MVAPRCAMADAALPGTGAEAGVKAAATSNDALAMHPAVTSASSGAAPPSDEIGMSTPTAAVVPAMTLAPTPKALLGKGFTPRTADRLRLPIQQLPSVSCSTERIPRHVGCSSAGRPTVRGLRGVDYTPPPLSAASKAVTARTRRTESDTPLNSSARKRLSSGAFWLSELKLRQATPRARTPRSRTPRQPDTYRARPISTGTPRDTQGEVLKPMQIAQFFEQQQRLHTARGVDPRAVDPMMYVTRGEMSDIVPRDSTTQSSPPKEPGAWIDC